MYIVYIVWYNIIISTTLYKQRFNNLTLSAASTTKLQIFASMKGRS